MPSIQELFELQEGPNDFSVSVKQDKQSEYQQLINSLKDAQKKAVDNGFVKAFKRKHLKACELVIVAYPTLDELDAYIEDEWPTKAKDSKHFLLALVQEDKQYHLIATDFRNRVIRGELSVSNSRLGHLANLILPLLSSVNNDITAFEEDEHKKTFNQIKEHIADGLGYTRIKVFLSYAWASEEYPETFEQDKFYQACVEQIAVDLEQAGLAVFLDKWCDVPGREVSNFIAEAIEQSHYIVPIGTCLYNEKFKRNKNKSPSFSIKPVSEQSKKNLDHVLSFEVAIIQELSTKSQQVREKIIPLFLEVVNGQSSFPFLLDKKIPVYMSIDYYKGLYGILKAAYQIDPKESLSMQFASPQISKTSVKEGKTAELFLEHKEKMVVIEIAKIYKDNAQQSNPVLFAALAKEGHTWSHILNELVFKDGLSNVQREGNKSIVEGLISKRDELDAFFYNEAVRKLFPVTSFSINTNKRQINKDDLSGVHLSYYTFEVSPLITGGSKKAPLVTIEVIAPGSRNLTSDIDTTVKVDCHDDQHLTAKLKAIDWPKEILSSEIIYDGNDACQVDLEAALQAAIIYYFNQLSFKQIKITSAESRDSNVYGDGFLKEKGGYPKFNGGKNIRLPDESPLLTEPTQVFYKAQKRQKQIYEFAASLMPLRCYYDKAGLDWENFETDAMGQLNELIDEDNIGKVDSNLKEVFKEVKNFHQYFVNELNKAKKDYKQEYLHKIDLTAGEQDIPKDRENDFEVYCYQAIYVRCLVILAGHKASIARQLQTVEGERVTLQPAYENITKKENTLEKVKDSEYEQDAKDKLVDAKRAYKNSKEILIKALEHLAKLCNIQQELQIQANLFAYEGYVNRSAVYHVVDWIQSAGKLPIAKQQVVVGSILQQVGFRLLHSFVYRAQGLSEGEIAYRVAKYGERVAEMFFGELDTEWKKVVNNDQLMQLEVLRRLQQEPSFKGKLEKALLKIVNEDARFVKEIKKNEYIPIHLKGQKALELIQENIYRFHNPSRKDVSENDRNSVDKKKIEMWRNDNQKQLMAGAVKTLMFAYQARLTKTQGYLWGEGYCKPESQEAEGIKEKKRDEKAKAF